MQGPGLPGSSGGRLCLFVTKAEVDLTVHVSLGHAFLETFDRPFSSEGCPILQVASPSAHSALQTPQAQLSQTTRTTARSSARIQGLSGIKPHVVLTPNRSLLRCLLCVHEGKLVVFCHTHTKLIHVRAESLRLWMSLICSLTQQGQCLVHLALLLSRQGFPRRFALLHHLMNFERNPRPQIEQAFRPGRQRLTTERTRLGQALLLQLQRTLAELVAAREVLGQNTRPSGHLPRGTSAK